MFINLSIEEQHVLIAALYTLENSFVSCELDEHEVDTLRMNGVTLKTINKLIERVIYEDNIDDLHVEGENGL